MALDRLRERVGKHVSPNSEEAAAKRRRERYAPTSSPTGQDYQAELDALHEWLLHPGRRARTLALTRGAAPGREWIQHDTQNGLCIFNKWCGWRDHILHGTPLKHGCFC